MRNDYDSNLIDLGNAVVETKGTAILGQVDPLSGKREGAGFSNEDWAAPRGAELRLRAFLRQSRARTHRAAQ